MKLTKTQRALWERLKSGNKLLVWVSTSNWRHDHYCWMPPGGVWSNPRITTVKALLRGGFVEAKAAKSGHMIVIKRRHHD
jgi:hypothetical protein